MFLLLKFFFILMFFLFISSCHEKDYDIFKDFIMKDQQTENLKKIDTSEQKKSNKANIEKQNKQVDILETKKTKTSPLRVNEGQKKKS